MSDITVDRLIYELDGDLAPLKATYRQAEAETQRSAQNIHGIWSATAQQNVGGFKNAAESVKQFHSHVAVSRRELIYLAREVATGDFQRMPATIALIASHFAGLSSATLATAAAVAAVPAAFVLAAYQIERAQSRIQTAIAATGYTAGATQKQLVALAGQLDRSSGLSFRGGLDALAILNSRGNVPVGLQGMAARGAEGLSQLTGKSLDDAAKQLEAALADPVKGAQELDQQLKLLTYSQSEEIRHLVAIGNLQGAQERLLGAVNTRANEAAESLSKFDRMLQMGSKGLSDFWSWLGTHAGGAARVAGGIPIIGTAVGGIQSLIDNMPGAKTPTEAEAAARARAAAADQAIRNAMPDVNKGAESFQHHLDDLQEELNRVALAARLAKGAGSEYADVIEKHRQNLARALPLEKARTPEALAAQAAADALAVARASPQHQATLAATLSARRTFEANMANPAMGAEQARAIYGSQMAAAAAGDIKVGARQALTLATMQAEANAERDVAKAYDEGLAAVLRAKTAGQAHVEMIKGAIGNEKAYAEALRVKAFWTEASSLAQKAANDDERVAGARRLLGAGGDPVKLAEITARNEALAATATARATATKKEEIAAVDDLTKKLITQNLELDRNTKLAQANAAIFRSGQQVAGAQNRAGVFGAGGDRDDLRHLEAMQAAFDEAATLFKKGTPEFEEYFRKQAKLNVVISDLNESFDRLHKEASDLASDVTGPIRDFLRNGGNPLATLAQIGQNILGTLVENNLIDPLQKKLEGLFGGALGAPGSSPATPSYTWVLNGGLGGGGGLGDIAGNLFGSSGGGSLPFSVFGGITGGVGGSGINQAAKGGGGGVLSAIASIFSWFGGLFDEGGTIGPGQWGIKSGKPEIIQGGMHGVSVVPLASPSVVAAISRVHAANSNEHDHGGRVLGGGGPSTVILHMNFNGPNVDKKSVLSARGQMEASFTRIVNRGSRST